MATEGRQEPPCSRVCGAEGTQSTDCVGERTERRYAVTESAHTTLDRAMSEATWQRQITDLADQLGYLWYHNPDSRYPDLVLCHPERGVCYYIEVKAQKGRLSYAQQVWANALIAAGARYFCWRPSQWDEVRQVLGGYAE